MYEWIGTEKKTAAKKEKEVSGVKTVKKLVAPESVGRFPTEKGRQALGTGLTVQRKLVEYRTVPEHRAKLAGYLDAINNAVQQAAKTALQIPSLRGVQDRRIALWVKAAMACDRRSLPPFLYAQYGYAVETLAMHAIRQIGLPQGYTMQEQVTYGATRPDMVIYFQGARGLQEIAWLDITSDNSQGHIFRKSGTKWRTVPMCYEITYPRLDVLGIQKEDNLSAADKEKLAQIAAQEEEQEKQMMWAFCYDMKNNMMIKEKKAETRKHLFDLFHVNFSHDAIRSLFEIWREWDMNVRTKYKMHDLLRLKGYGRNDFNGRNKPEAMAFIYKYYTKQANVEAFNADPDIEMGDEESDMNNEKPIGEYL